MPKPRYYGHSADRAEHWEPLEKHLQAVAERAREFAEPLGLGEEAYLAGLLHDLGKYSPLFHKRLLGQASRLDHWSSGGLVANENGAPAAALAILGHHLGLPKAGYEFRELHKLTFDKLEQHHERGLVLTEKDERVLLRRFRDDGLELPELTPSTPDSEPKSLATMLDIRMLFSCLVDADFLETEAHFNGQAEGRRIYREPGPELDPSALLSTLDRHLGDLAAERRSETGSQVFQLRQDLLAACRRAASRQPGLFNLAAPTGSGKTLAMLAFALEHAKRHGLRRVVVAIPYLSILEQTAEVYRRIFEAEHGPEVVLEHHSLVDHEATEKSKTGDLDHHDDASQRARLLTQNWDAPIVVTTNVQLMQSLFANCTSPCRKLHRLAGSVILLDEVQTFPKNLVLPTLGALSHLAHRYGCSVVMATATQPAFEHLDSKIHHLAGSPWQPREIAPPELGLFGRQQRTHLEWRLDPEISWDDLAAELADSELEQGLVVVNLKRHAKELAQALKTRGIRGVKHLSTHLCPAHRQELLAEVRQRPADKKPCLLVSTQCIEAGVDVDFPIVYRALAPLESIAQAAGRCNRAGLGDSGRVVVFRPEDEGYPPGPYETAATLTQRWANRRLYRGLDLSFIEDPALFESYYQGLYKLTKDLEMKKVLDDGIFDLDFPAVAEHYRWIDQKTIQVVVPYDRKVFEDLQRKAEEKLDRQWFARARHHSVGLFVPREDSPIQSVLIPVADRIEGWYFLAEKGEYHEELGFVEPGEDLLLI